MWYRCHVAGRTRLTDIQPLCVPQSEPGMLLRRALNIRAASRMGIHVRLDDVAADEFHAMLILDEEREKWEREQQVR